MSSTTNATSSAISIFPNNRQGQSHNNNNNNINHHSQTPSQAHSHSQRRSTVTPTATATTATKPLPMVGVGVGVGGGGGIGVGLDIDYDMSMGMSMSMGMGVNMNMGMGMGAGDLDMHIGSYHAIDMDMAMSSEDQQQQHLMSWSPRPTNSFQNRFYPAASPGSLFNPIAMPAPNLSSSPIPINSRKSSNNAMNAALASAKLSGAFKTGSSSKHTRRAQPRRSRASQNTAERGGADGSGNGDGEGEDGGNAEDGLDGSEEEDDNPDVDRDSEAPNSLTVSAQGGNYVCCGVTLPDLHALVDHFENAHVHVIASPSFEALSAGMGMTSAPNVVVPPPSASGNHNSNNNHNNAVTPSGNVSTFAASVTSATATSTTATSTSSSSTTPSSASPYEFPAPPFDTDDMDISLSDDGPSPSPPLTPATTPSPTTSAFDPIRVVYHHHPAGVNMGMGGVGSAVGAGVGVSGYGMGSMRSAGATFTMGGYGGMNSGAQYLSPTTVLSVSSSSSSAAASAAAAGGGSAGMPLPYFRPSTYSSLAGGNGPIMNMNHHHHHHLTPVAAFNRYAGYSDYSSQLPGTDPSPTYPYSTSTSVGKLHSGASSGSGSANGVYHPHHHLGGNVNGVNGSSAATGYSAAGAAPTASCLSPALLFSSSTEASPLNTPSSSRTGSPVDGQHQSSHARTSTSALPKGTLPLHPSSSSSTSNTGSSTSIAPSRRTPPPSSLPSTATAAGSSSSSSSHHPLSKPFKCPKPGCNKSYKQQNGLKYHLSHGQCNFAPRDPEVEKLSEQEREKRMRPFVCKVPVAVPSGGSTGGNGNGSTGAAAGAAAGGSAASNVNGAGNGVYVECGRRYKNMNGLRYHYQHTGEHGAIGLEMLAQGRHPLPDLPSGYSHSHSHSNSSSTSLSRSDSKSGSGLSTPTSPITPNNTTSSSTTTTSSAASPSTIASSPSIILPAINTSILTIPSAPTSTSASSPTPILSASSPHLSPSPILSVPATPVTPSPVSPHPPHHPHPLRISNSVSALISSSSSSSSTPPSSSSLSMPPSPSRFGSNGSSSLAYGGPLANGFAGSGVGANGNGYATIGKSISYPSSPVSSSVLQSPSQQQQHQQGVQSIVPLHLMSQYYRYPTGQ